MALIFITGASTSGKSTVARELKKRGYLTYDTERQGISAWYDKETGKRVAGFGEIPDRSQSWFDRHAWNISIKRIKEIADEAEGKLIFLCGVATNNHEVREMCDTVIWLKTNEKTIRHRVKLPREHDWGTQPHELAGAINGNMEGETEYEKYGAIMIDTTQPIEKIVSAIIQAAK